MDFSQSFSALNEKLRPRITSNERLYSSLSRLEDRQSGSLRSSASYYRPTVLPNEPEPTVSVAEPEDPQEPEEDTRQGQGDSSPLSFQSSFPELDLKDVGEEELVDEDSRISPSEEKDIPGELTSRGADGPTETEAGEGGSSFQKSYMDGTLPDLIRSGRPLRQTADTGTRLRDGRTAIFMCLFKIRGRDFVCICKRWVTSQPLKEVRREVELSRRRSIRLKAQVEKLQESREGQGWSQHREMVTQEVLSVLRLLRPLTEPEPSTAEPSDEEKRLDYALAELQNVARKLAISHTQQQVTSGKGADESAILQQALRDRDEAIEKKKAMEAELLRSKTEMMQLNNQLLEAVQKRLELSLELENWKEDVQLMLQQQLLSQQQAEQSQKKTSRLGLLRRNNKPPIQRPSNFPLSTPPQPTTNSNQIFISKSSLSAPPTPSTPPAQRNWMDKLRRGKNSRQGDQDAAEQGSAWGGGDNGFQVVSLD
ncbi:hypothetical protein L3Q82_022359 [Scortum barcoo]|uniref:Uncharacterized protein n=1 Tax=Scortum barcoo TaxID=214431 RepID=A0ACB8X247_9TELE|nr:hypothetical protein L3Q82_022359 [Scortum barcoo]